MVFLNLFENNFCSVLVQWRARAEKELSSGTEKSEKREDECLQQGEVAKESKETKSHDIL